ncbi:adenosylcobinamide-phosphate synthase CbiB [Chitinimonas taiwanensis]|uniref:Cobalamin biosynthesis protein CobD n=1 Tax=Chitinimonas taiwanensis DSM 18899 TaxID=1121279 RepID=A0A1K2HNL9_9NEIS|nr:adenosylcobinamide-phosphate synthase CbiB [Chitinimonas taiwanensis]SFZ78374.1 adenosylcobinamide-phosphate synthase [Chitinimonas taiwanensis DSM 18899]
MLELSPGHWLAAFALGLGLEALLGEPRRWHALVGFGRLAQGLEASLNRGRARIARGLLAWCGLVLGGVALFIALRSLLPDALQWLADGLALWFALGARSLFTHIAAIATPLAAGDLATARAAVARIVSRDCSTLEADGIAAAGLESALENGADAIFASLCWFALLGGPGVLLHRLANTLDAMWGYRSARFLQFGRVAARADDVLCWLPARLTALSYALLGHRRSALHSWRRQAPLWDSPNAGPVMAAGAGALGVQLGGPACYHGQWETRPLLGQGHKATAADLMRGVQLLRRTLLLWLLVLGLLGGLRLCWS